MSKLDTLYKRAKTGKIVYYFVRTEGATIIKETGQYGTTKPIEHRDTKTKGKNIGKANETTPEEQAVLEMESAWRKKQDEGYKTLSTITGLNSGEWNCDGTFIEIGFGAESRKFTLAEYLQDKLPQFNTDASGNIKPMLATDWEVVKKKGIPYPCLLQPKLDGVRCLMVATVAVVPGNMSIEVKFMSRSGKEYTTLTHVGADVAKYIVANPTTESFVLDGEVYSDEITFQDITAAVKKQQPNSLKLKFRAYDIVNDDAQDIRWETTRKLVEAMSSSNIISVPTQVVWKEEEVISLHDHYVGLGFEGVMLRLTDGAYGKGQRSRSLLKVKVFDHTEFKFKGFVVGKRPEDLIAVLECDGGEFRAKMEGSKAHKADLQKQDIPHGSELTVKHFGYTDSGIPRFPIGIAFRDYE